MDSLKHILIVDDESDILSLLKDTLESSLNCPLKVSQANNGADALQFLKLNKPDLLITDLKMPKMNGVELLKEIKKIPAKDRPSSILVTSGYIEDDVQFDQKIHIMAIKKPWLAEDISKAAAQLLGDTTLFENTSEPSELEEFKQVIHDSVLQALGAFFSIQLTPHQTDAQSICPETDYHVAKNNFSFSNTRCEISFIVDSDSLNGIISEIPEDIKKDLDSSMEKAFQQLSDKIFDRIKRNFTGSQVSIQSSFPNYYFQRIKTNSAEYTVFKTSSNHSFTLQAKVES